MRLARKHLVSALAVLAFAAPAVANAQPGHGMPPPGQVRHDDRRDDRHDDRRDDRRDDNRGGRPAWHFDQNRRDQFAQHYRADAMRWRNRRRPNFTPGYVIPRTYAIRPVPTSYWAGQPPPPPGYRYGYYDGYVVAYDPTTRVVADVLDLVAGFAGR